MSQDNDNKPLIPAQDEVPTPPSGSPLEQALKRAQIEAEGVQAEAAENSEPDASADAGDNAGTSADQTVDETADTKSDEPEKAEQADAQPEEAKQEEDNPPAENSIVAEDGENREQETAPENLPAEKESSLPATQEDEPEEEADGEGGCMSIMDHLREVRKRLCLSFVAALVGFVCCWAFVEPVFDILTKPMLEVLPNGSVAMYTTLPEAFFTRMYIAFIVGLFAASPFIFYQIWCFISPGLYNEEKKFIIPVAIVSAIFFIAGGLFCYYIVFHYAFSFFMSFTTQDIVAMPKISDYLDFVLKLVLAFGLVFEMPIFSFFLSRMGVLTAEKMRNFRSYAVLIIFIVAAILTPPDVVSQLLMAIPMLLLYEVSILVAVVFGKKEAVEEDSSEEDDEEDAAEASSEDEEKAKEKAGTEAGTEAVAEKTVAKTSTAPSADESAENSAEPDAEPAREEPADQDASPDAEPVSEAASGTVSGSADASSEQVEAEEQKTICLEKKPASSDKEQPAKGQE